MCLHCCVGPLGLSHLSGQRVLCLTATTLERAQGIAGTPSASGSPVFDFYWHKLRKALSVPSGPRVIAPCGPGARGGPPAWPATTPSGWVRAATWSLLLSPACPLLPAASSDAAFPVPSPGFLSEDGCISDAAAPRILAMLCLPGLPLECHRWGPSGLTACSHQAPGSPSLSPSSLSAWRSGHFSSNQSGSAA